MEGICQTHICYSAVWRVFLNNVRHTWYRLDFGHSKRGPKLVFQDLLLLNTGQKEHSAILSTFIKLPFVIKTGFLSIFEWPLKTVLLYVAIWVGMS